MSQTHTVPTGRGNENFLKEAHTESSSIGKPTTSAPSYAEVSTCRTAADLQQKVHNMDTQKDIARVQALGSGDLPPSWGHRLSEVKTEKDYRRGSVLAESVLRNGAPQQQRFARCAQKQQQMGLVDSRTVAEMLSVRGVNPYAVDQMAHEVIRRFRVKSLSLVAMQNISTLIIALVVERIVTHPEPRTPESSVHNYRVAMIWLATIAALIVTSCVRHRYPFNYLCSVIFTLLVGVAVGCLTGPCAEMTYKSPDKVEAPQLYVLGFYIIGVLLFALMAVFSPPKQTELRRGRQVRPDKIPLICLALLSATITSVSLVIFWSIHAFVPARWLALIIIGTSFPLIWVGYAFNRLCSRLNPDEYFYPMILIWVDLFIVIVTMVICLLMFCSGGGSDSGGSMDTGGAGEDFGGPIESGPDTGLDTPGLDTGGDVNTGGEVGVEGGDVETGFHGPLYAGGGTGFVDEPTMTEPEPGLANTRITL